MPDTNIYTSKLNTGKITFNNGIKIIGALGGSSDGEVLDTIELVPDIDQYDGDQYLVVEPNVDESRIHIRAGGTIDDSAAKLVIGGLTTHVALSDQDTDRIIIRTKNTAEDGNHAWSFTSNGAMGFPNLDINLQDDGVTNVELLQFANNALYSVITGAAPVGGDDVKPLIVQGLSGTGGAQGGNIYVYSGSATGADAGSVTIKAGGSTGVGNWGGAIGLTSGSNPDATGSDITLTAGSGSSSANAGKVQINSGSYYWQFKPNGNVIIPDGKDIQDVAGNTAISGGNRVKNYSSSSGTVVPIDENNIYSINTTSQATTVKLPNTSNIPIGYNLMVFDNIGNAASKNITITADTIAGDSIISAPSGIAIDTNYGLLAFKHVGGKSWVILYGR